MVVCWLSIISSKVYVNGLNPYVAPPDIILKSILDLFYFLKCIIL